MRKVEKSFIIISIALISLLCIGAVSAADDIAADDVAAADSEDIGSIDDNINEDDDSSLEIADVAEDNPPTEVLKEDSTESNDVLGEDAPKTFTQLKDEIANPVDGVVTLSGTYKYDETADADLGTDGISIASPMTIKGPATIDGSGLTRIFTLAGAITIKDLTFINGLHDYGGALWLRGTSPALDNCVFKDNKVIGGDYNMGGAIYNTATGATITGCTFEDNIADIDNYGAGGAIYDYGDGLTIKDSTFRHNQAFTGGALESYGTNMNIDGCLFDSNQAVQGPSGPYYNGDAGAIMLNYVLDDSYEGVESNHKLNNSIFINNQAGNTASTLKNEAIGTTISNCIFLGPNTYMGNSIFSGCGSGTTCENLWLGHTTENQSTYVSGGPDNWLVLDLTAVAEDGHYNVTVSLNNLFTRSTGEVTPVESGISNILFNVLATAGACDETVEIQDGIGSIIYTLYKPEDGTISVDYNGVTKSLSLEGLEKPPEDISLNINVDDIKKGETAKVEGQLTDLNGAGIGDAKLVVVVNGIENNVTTASDGKFSLDVEDLAAGQYSAFVTFAGTDDYNRAVNSTIFNVKAEPQLEVYIDDIKEGEENYIVVNLKDGETDLDGVVDVSISGYEDPFIVAVAEGLGTAPIVALGVGTYTYNATFRGNDNYFSVSTEPKTFKVTEVIKTNPNLAVSVDNIKVGETAKVEGQLTDSNGNAIGDAKLVLVVNGVEHNVTTGADGKFSWDVEGLDIGQYTAVAVFSGDDDFNPAYKSAVFNVEVKEESLVVTALSIAVADVKKGETAKVEGQLTNVQTGAGISGIPLTVVVNGVEKNINTDADGKFLWNVEGLEAGQYSAFVTFAGNDNFKSSFSSTIFNVKAEPQLEVYIDDVKEGEEAYIVVTLKDGETDLDGVVDVSISGYEDPFIVAVAEGLGTAPIVALNAGTYTYNATFRGNANYFSVSTEPKTFEVLKVIKTNVDISVNDGNIVVKVTDEEGNPVDGAKVNITLDGATQEYTTDKGIVTIPATAGDHNMSISTEDGKTIIVKVVAGESSPDGNDTPVVDKIGTVVSAAHTTINTYNKAIDTKDNAYILITLKDAKGNVLANTPFKFIAEGKVLSYVTDAKGQKKVYLLYPSKKTVSAVVFFAGDNKYAESFKALKIKVNPQKVKIVAKKQTFKATKKVKKFKATLKNSKGKGIKGKKLVFVVNKKKYTAKTNKKGVATVKVKLTAKKTYKVTVKFAGDQTYKKATKKAKIKIK